MGEVLTPRKQAVVDRLRRRIENYRRRQTDFMPRFDQTFNGLCEQNIQETLLLKQKFLENKAKRTAKKQDKKQSEIPNNIQNNLLAQQKFLKRSADDLDGPGEYGDSGPKLQCGGGGGGGASGGAGGGGTGGPQAGAASRPKESLTKFSVEIVQQLEFTTSAANSQPQQISTNVTVKALTNASVKSDVGGTNSPKSGAEGSAQSNGPNGSAQRTSNCVDLGNLVECKQEPDSEFVDLEQCAAALEKDAQNNGASFPVFSEFIGDEGGDEIITSDAFKDLISEISDFHPEFMKEFDFDEHKPNISALANSLNEAAQNGVHANVVTTSITTTNQMKVESDSKENIQIHQQHMIDVGKGPPGTQGTNVQYPPGAQYEPNALGKSRIPPYSSLEFGKAELSPAAQTLKQMAEQHQHKTQMGMTFPAARNPRSPYGDYQFGSNSDYINSPSSTNTPPSSGQFINKNIPPPSSQNFNNQSQSTSTGNGQSLPEVKQEVMFTSSQTQSFQATGPGNIEMQKRMQAMQQHQQQMGGQAQSPQGPKTPTNPAMIGGYKQQYSPYGSPGGHGSPGYMPRPQGSGGPFGSGSGPSRPPSVPAGAPTLQMTQAQQMQVSQQTSTQQIQVSAGQHMQLSGELKPNVSVAAQQQQGMFFNQQSDTYTVSQSQTINFTQQNMRGRGVGPVPRTEQQHKLMQQQQQQMIRVQQQQMGIRPPPPEYKPAQPQMIHSMQQQQQPPQPQPQQQQQQQQQPRFPPGVMRRQGPGQQPMPPSGPMMRPQHAAGGTVFMGNPGMARTLAPGGYMPRQRPPNVSVGPDGMPMTNRGGAEWRHILMSQQQSMGFSHVRQFSPHQGNFAAVQNNPTGMQMHPQRRGHLPPGATGQMQIIPHEQQVMMQGQPTNTNQMSMNLQMSQSQNMSLSSGMVNSHHPHMHHMTPSGNSHVHQFSNSSGYTNNSFVNCSTSSSTQTTVTNALNANNMNANVGNGGGGPPGTGGGSGGGGSGGGGSGGNTNQSANDFSFEFLDSLPGDSSFSAQDLLSSLDSTSNFNLNDIL